MATYTFVSQPYIVVGMWGWEFPVFNCEYPDAQEKYGNSYENYTYDCQLKHCLLKFLCKYRKVTTNICENRILICNLVPVNIGFLTENRIDVTQYKDIDRTIHT